MEDEEKKAKCYDKGRTKEKKSVMGGNQRREQQKGREKKREKENQKGENKNESEKKEANKGRRI